MHYIKYNFVGHLKARGYYFIDSVAIVSLELL